ncbi:hypothetical protein PGTUg99_005202 [Puccinia graminis f. sp. tritici]|uniref:Uncharacterized protein n=1 Tax=Puccinia graminis f. sp. tritici TaxID=56615 RepID=A0A5B0SHD1_PUCGR|nr:hypothetical protein PGTUg99_005202 [Puccinia graminis f. sp. tritici]
MPTQVREIQSVFAHGDAGRIRLATSTSQLALPLLSTQIFFAFAKTLHAMRQRLTLLILYYVKAANSMAQPGPVGLSHAVNEAEEVPVATMAVDRSAMSSHNPLSPKSSTPGTSQISDSQATQADKTGQIETITWPVKETSPHEVPKGCENKPPGSLESSRATDHAEEENSRTKLNFIQKLTLSFTTGNPVPAATTGVHRVTMNSDNPLSPKSSVPGVSDQISQNAQRENSGRVDPIQWPVTEKPSEVPEELRRLDGYAKWEQHRAIQSTDSLEASDLNPAPTDSTFASIYQ